MKLGSDGEICALPEAPGGPKAVELSAAERQDALRRTEALSRIVEACAQAMTGTLPRDREPLMGQPQKLSEEHIAMIMDEGAGMTSFELAEKYGFHVGYVRTILCHPDAITLKSLILGSRADKLTDIQARLDHLAPEALTVKVGLMRGARNENLRDKIATDILSMAGYGERKKVDLTVDAKHTLVMPAQVATGLTNALAESRRIASVDYSQYLVSAPEEGAESRPPQSPEQAPAGSLPTASPALTMFKSRVA